jgi:hypothetical protein
MCLLPHAGVRSPVFIHPAFVTFPEGLRKEDGYVQLATIV